MAELKVIKTAAEQGLAEAFAGARATLPGAAAVKSLRDSAFHTFEAKGLPHRRVEEWKYTDLRALMRDAKPLAPPPDAAARKQAGSAGSFLAGAKPRRIVIVDGAFAADLSDLAALEPGLSIGSLAEALSKGEASVVERVGRTLPLADDPAFALNTAMMGDGAVVRVADGAQIARPIHLVFVTTPVRPVSVFTRSLLSVGKGASAAIFESHESADGVDHQANHAFDVSIGDEGRLDHVKVAREGDRMLHIATLVTELGSNARLNDFTFTAGGAVTRNQIAMRLNGAETHAGIRGATLLKDHQHTDNTLVVDHAVGHCESRELFKAVLDGESRSVFQGKIIVQPHAQKTDAKMATHALLLSDDAEADAKPELEIFADDVVCGHGATAGALDDDLLFYLKARGIPQKEAEALMVEAFIGEAVEAVESEAVREALMDVARAWLKARA
ncbi:MAG: Fe-S cluster assembly protein SufD [Pseudorhodoplanes sp.]|uniref:Fe-S cluster assembly protein SufD n=1 Tax=Pseudorhodoplanes sp. TaxID=1934341 RepID=UPI003D113CBC